MRRPRRRRTRHCPRKTMEMQYCRWAIRSVREACVLIYTFISALSTACLRILVSIPVAALYGPPERPAVVPLFSTTSQNKSVPRYHRTHPPHSLLRRYPECPDSIASLWLLLSPCRFFLSALYQCDWSSHGCRSQNVGHGLSQCQSIVELSILADEW